MSELVQQDEALGLRGAARNRLIQDVFVKAGGEIIRLLLRDQSLKVLVLILALGYPCKEEARVIKIFTPGPLLLASDEVCERFKYVLVKIGVSGELCCNSTRMRDPTIGSRLSAVPTCCSPPIPVSYHSL